MLLFVEGWGFLLWRESGRGVPSLLPWAKPWDSVGLRRDADGGGR